jgi:hypothetical protein
MKYTGRRANDFNVYRLQVDEALLRATVSAHAVLVHSFAKLRVYVLPTVGTELSQVFARDRHFPMRQLSPW